MLYKCKPQVAALLPLMDVVQVWTLGWLLVGPSRHTSNLVTKFPEVLMYFRQPSVPASKFRSRTGRQCRTKQRCRSNIHHNSSTLLRRNLRFPLQSFDALTHFTRGGPWLHSPVFGRIASCVRAKARLLRCGGCERLTHLPTGKSICIKPSTAELYAGYVPFSNLVP